MAREACSRGLTGWERLLTTRDAAERALVRLVLTGAIAASDERTVALAKASRCAWATTK